MPDPWPQSMPRRTAEVMFEMLTGIRDMPEPVTCLDCKQPSTADLCPSCYCARQQKQPEPPMSEQPFWHVACAGKPSEDAAHRPMPVPDRDRVEQRDGVMRTIKLMSCQECELRWEQVW